MLYKIPRLEWRSVMMLLLSTVTDPDRYQSQPSSQQLSHAQGNVIVCNINAFHCEKDAGGWNTARDYN